MKTSYKILLLISLKKRGKVKDIQVYYDECSLSMKKKHNVYWCIKSEKPNIDFTTLSIVLVLLFHFLKEKRNPN